MVCGTGQIAYSGAVPTLDTFAGLALILVAAITVRLRWPTMGAKARRRWLIAVSLVVAPTLLTLATKWDVQSLRFINLEQWVRIAAGEVALVFFTLLRPRVLSLAVVVVLLPFFLSTSVAGPLSNLFREPVVETLPIADGYILQTISWESEQGGNSGVDFDLSYRPRHLPGIRRGITGTRLYNTQCNTSAVFATLKPSGRALDVYCPPFPPGDAKAVVSGTHAHYLVPPGAMSANLRRLARR